MANTYTLIASNTLSSSAASVTFSSIPSTYTDLVLRISGRGDANNGTFFDNINLTFNGSSSANYSRTLLQGAGSGGASSSRTTNQTSMRMSFATTGSDATTNTFSNVEIYIPSYTASQNKPLGAFDVTESNNTDVYLGAIAGLWSNTSAITSIGLASASGNFVSGSSFFLYGIKNS